MPVKLGVNEAVFAVPVPLALETVTESVSVPPGRADTSTPDTVWLRLPMVPEPITVADPPLEEML